MSNQTSDSKRDDSMTPRVTSDEFYADLPSVQLPSPQVTCARNYLARIVREDTKRDIDAEFDSERF